MLSQPSLPFAIGKARKRSLGLSDADLAKVAAREELCVMAMRFTGDRMVPDERFAHLKEVLGDRAIIVDIDNTGEHLVDEEGHPTHDALHGVLGFFKEKLTV